MKNRITALLVALLALQVLPITAEETKAEKAKPAPAEKADKATVEKKSDWVPNEEWNKLSDEEKAQKLKERREKAEARVKALKEKKAAGTLTPAEEKQLERLEARGKRTPGKPRKDADKKADEAKADDKK
jgi:hypothetical protein